MLVYFHLYINLVQEYLTASEVIRAITNACEETLMSLDELDVFVTKNRKIEGWE